MKKLGVFIVVILTLALFSCGGGGGGGGGGSSTSTPATPQTVARFVSSLDGNFVMSFNSGAQAVCTTSIYNVLFDLDYFTWSFQSGNFTNGVLNFSGPQNPTITITNSSFIYHNDGGNETSVHFTKDSDTGATAVFSGSWASGLNFEINFKSDNTYSFSESGIINELIETGTYSISSGDFNNGSIVIDGETITVTNGQFSFVESVTDYNNQPANLTMTFVKQ